MLVTGHNSQFASDPHVALPHMVSAASRAAIPVVGRVTERNGSGSHCSTTVPESGRQSAIVKDFIIRQLTLRQLLQAVPPAWFL